MARLITSGFEIYSPSASGLGGEVGSPDGFSLNAAAARVTTGQRSGTGCFRANTTAASAAVQFPFSGVNGRGYWARAYIKIGSLPSNILRFLLVSDSINSTQGVFLDTTGHVYHSNATGTLSASINDGAWHRIETYTLFSATQASRAWELRVDGTTISSGTAQTTDALAPLVMYVGWPSANTADIYFDDAALNDDQGTTQNTWPGDGYVILLVPNADNSRGSWTGGAGGTTNLWDALNNVPPVGATAPGTNASQISANAVATTGKFDTTSYTTAGATAGDIAVLCHVVACHGEQVATGTKSGSASTDTAVNNTPSSATGAINYGLDIGAEGAWPTNWRWSMGNGAAYATQPTLSSGTRLNIVTTTISRVADCCFLGLYVEMQAPPARRSLVAPARAHQIRQLTRWY